MTPRPVVLSWSGGKDSAMALHLLREGDDHEVVALLTTVAAEHRRISHHGVRVELLERQAAAVGVPLDIIWIPADRCTNEDYEALMADAMARYRRAGIDTVAFGDIFLQELRDYRERNLARAGMQALFPLWGRDTAELARTFIALGFRAHLVCVDGTRLGPEFAGRPIDLDLLRDLPADVDPCGENGEYHSFVYDGPIFTTPLAVQVGEIVWRDVRHFADLM